MWRYGVIGNTMDFDSIISDSSSDAATKRGNTQLDFHLDCPFKSCGMTINFRIYGGMVELADTTGLSPVALRA